MIFFDISPLRAVEAEPLLCHKKQSPEEEDEQPLLSDRNESVGDNDDDGSLSTAESVVLQDLCCFEKLKSAMQKPKATQSKKRVHFDLTANKHHEHERGQLSPEEKSLRWYDGADMFNFRLLAAQTASELTLENLKWKVVLDRIYDTSRNATPTEMEQGENPLAYYRSVLTLIYQDIEELIGLEHYFLPQSLQEAEVRRSAILQCQERTHISIRDSCMERLCLPSRLFSHELAAAQYRCLDRNDGDISGAVSENDV